MPTIAQYVEKDPNFLSVKGRRKLTDREAALLNSVFVVAESQLSKLKVKYEKKDGDKRVEVERVKTATIATMAAARIEGFGNWLTTPYIDYFPKNQSEEKVIEGQTVDLEASPVSLEEVDIPSSERLEPNDREVANSLPGWSKSIVLFIEQTFARMTPLTTAIWFLIVVVGFGVLGFAQKTYLESTFDYMSKENDRLSKDIAIYEKKQEKYNTIEAKASENSKIISGLKDENNELKGEKQTLESKLGSQNKEFQSQLVDLQTEQQKTIAKYQENAESAIKNQIEALTESKQRLQTLNSSNESKIQNLSKENRHLLQSQTENENVISENRETIENLNTTASQQQKQLRSLQKERSQKNSLVSFNNSILELVYEVLYESRWSRANPFERREDFTKGFIKLREAQKNTLDKLGIRNSM